LSENNPTNEMGSRLITNINNKELKEDNVVDKNGKNIIISNL
jgi:hypothetical protein